ncbi:MAG: universal stress protein [Proteobacteria bacterium]|nr:universal stress protein [Pseudomonadota bacterium]
MTQPHILAATDFLPKSRPAMARTAILARSLGANVTLVHVVPVDPWDPTASGRARAAQERMAELVNDPIWMDVTKPNTLVSTGQPARVILEVAAANTVDLLVLGPHGRRPFPDSLTENFAGTVATRLLAARTCPVLIVRETAHHSYMRVLMALDVSPIASAAIRAAEAMMVEPQADVSVLHAFDTPYMGLVEHGDVGQGMSLHYKSLWNSHATVSIRSLLRRASVDFARYGIQIDDATPARAILSAIDLQEPDLLVMGTRGRGPLRRALLGSVANEVLNEAWCDVFVVPEGSFAQAASPIRSSAVN